MDYAWSITFCLEAPLCYWAAVRYCEITGEAYNILPTFWSFWIVNGLILVGVFSVTK